MYGLEKFYSDVSLLSNSLVIKISDAASSMEIANFPNKKLDHDNKANWKYYLNISGNYHSTDSEVFINVIEEESTMVLTKELLENYPLTKAELLKCGDFYTNLVNAYPLMTLYIHGCMYPADIKTAIEADDGTILAYNTTLVEENEYNLIPQVEKFVKGFLDRWHIKAFSIIDSYYLVTMLGILYTNIKNEIINIRINNIRSGYVHSFFLESYFRSKFDLWENVKVLNKKTIMWLYMNLDYIIHHIGKNKTFETILSKVFDANDVGIGSYCLEVKDEVKNKNAWVYDAVPFDKADVVINMKRLNESYNINNDNNITIKEVLTQELNKLDNYTSDRKSYILEQQSGEIKEKTTSYVATKALEIATLKTFRGWNVDIYQVLIDYWGYMLKYGIYGSLTDDSVTTAKKEFTDPTTKQHYNINSKVGYLMLLKVLLHSIGKTDLLLTDVIYSTVLNPNTDITNIITKQLFQDGYTEFHLNYLNSAFPRPNKSYTSYVDVSEFLTSVIDYYRNVYILVCNSENTIVNTNIRQFLFLASDQDRVKLHNSDISKTIDELLQIENINFIMTDEYDHLATIKELFATCLGVTVNDDTALNELLYNYKEIARKLFSYTLQLFGSVESEEDIYVSYNTIMPFMTEKGIVSFSKDTVTVEPNDVQLFYSSFTPYTNNREINVLQHTPAPIFTICDGEHEQLHYEFSSGNLYRTEPDARLELSKIPVVDIDRCEHEQVFVQLNNLNYGNDNSQHQLRLIQRVDDTRQVIIDNESDEKMKLDDNQIINSFMTIDDN